jgi:hypothetical protein
VTIPASTRYRIFLSHSAHDLQLVQGIKTQLQAVGIEVYLYEEHSEPGRSITDKLQQAIRERDALVALLTSASGRRPFVHNEIGYAIGVGKPAVALVTPDVTDPDVLGMLEGEYIRLDPANSFDGMAKLLAYLRSQAQSQEAAAASPRASSQSDQLFQAIVMIAALLVVAYAMSQLAGTGSGRA